MSIKCLFDPYYAMYNVKSSNDIIQNFTIYGERHSGTNWLEKIISNKFNLPVTWDFGWKHFFGFQSNEKLNTANNTLFIGIVRNIYDWIGAMQKIPYHISFDNSKNHIVNLKPLLSKNHRQDIIYEDQNIYTHKLYKSIFELRYIKLHYLYYYMPLLVNNYILIRYEDLILHNEIIIKKIMQKYNLIPNQKYKILIDNSKLNNYKLKSVIFSTINNNTIWDMEKLFFYSRKYSHLDSRIPCSWKRS